jgi:hypothetical protein
MHHTAIYQGTTLEDGVFVCQYASRFEMPTRRQRGSINRRSCREEPQ